MRRDRFPAWQTRCNINCGEIAVLTISGKQRGDDDERRARFVTFHVTTGREPRRANGRRKKRAGPVGPRPWGRQYVLRAVQGDPAEGSGVLLCSCRKFITIATNVSATITRQGGKDCCQRWPGKCPWRQPRRCQRPPSFRDHRRKASVADRKYHRRAQRSGLRKIGLDRSFERLQGVRLRPVRDISSLPSVLFGDRSSIDRRSLRLENSRFDKKKAGLCFTEQIVPPGWTVHLAIFTELVIWIFTVSASHFASFYYADGVINNWRFLWLNVFFTGLYKIFYIITRECEIIMAIISLI